MIVGSGENRANPVFIPGLDLSGLFYEEAVAPLLAEHFPGLPHSAALIGYGSEVQGFDTERSTDHNWGPRLLLYLSEADHAREATAIGEMLSRRLPPVFRGYSTHFGEVSPDGARHMSASDDGVIEHKVEVHAATTWFTSHLGFDPLGAISVVDWLTVPQQMLVEVTAGRVYHDGLGLLHSVRERLAWYPDDVWRYLLAAQWGRISQQEAFVGRTGEVGDDLGSALVASDLVRDLMRLCFQLERRYAPYSKWFGTAFARLECAPRMLLHLDAVLAARDWRERERHLAPAYELAARMQNALSIAPEVEPTVRHFHTRPFLVLHAERFSEAIQGAIIDRDVLALIDRVGLVGGIDQISDNVDLKANPALFAKMRAFYG